ncbi:MAG TPA: hypothetical protein VGF25_10615 [Thermoleophilaceae bacterium]|jgi:hypothetical protein
MPRYICPSCHEVSESAGISRFDWCTACGQPLTTHDLVPVRPSVLAVEDSGVPMEEEAAPAPPAA